MVRREQSRCGGQIVQMSGGFSKISDLGDDAGLCYTLRVARHERSVSFIKSAVKPSDYPPPNSPEIVFIGRSNAGKSTLVNGVLGRPIAKVSGKPGKTLCLNFFSVSDKGSEKKGDQKSDKYRVVDVPGYGYAQRSQQDTAHWREMIETYLKTRENLVGAVLVMDVRRDWSEDEEQLAQWLALHGRALAVVLSKCDRLALRDRQAREKLLRQQSQQPHFFCTAKTAAESYLAIEKFAFTTWVQPWRRMTL